MQKEKETNNWRRKIFGRQRRRSEKEKEREENICKRIFWYSQCSFGVFKKSSPCNQVVGCYGGAMC